MYHSQLCKFWAVWNMNQRHFVCVYWLYLVCCKHIPVFFLCRDSAAFSRPQECVVSVSGVKLARMEERFICDILIGVTARPIPLVPCSQPHVVSCMNAQKKDKELKLLFTINCFCKTMVVSFPLKNNTLQN